MRSEVHRVRPIGTGVAAAALLLGASLLGPSARAATGSHAWAMDEPAGTGTTFDSGSPATDGNWLNIQAGVPGSSGTAYRFGPGRDICYVDSIDTTSGCEAVITGS